MVYTFVDKDPKIRDKVIERQKFIKINIIVDDVLSH